MFMNKNTGKPVASRQEPVGQPFVGTSFPSKQMGSVNPRSHEVTVERGAALALGWGLAPIFRACG